MAEDTEKEGQESLPDPATETDEKQPSTESSGGTEQTSKGDDTEPKTFEDAARQAFEESTAASSSSDEEEDGKKSDPKLGPDEKEKGEEGEEEEQTDGEKKTAEGEEEDETEDKGPVPYERFHEKIAQIEERDTRIKELEPMANNYQSIANFLMANKVTPEEFNQGMSILAAMKTDPGKAKELLQPFLSALNVFDGSQLPKDLQGEVDEGTLSPARAKEIAQLRAQRSFGEAKVQTSVQDLEKERISTFKNQSTEVLSTWISTKKGNDPDFQPKKNGDADGKYELWLLKMSEKMGSVKQPSDIPKLCEAAYREVSNTISRWIPKPSSRKALSSTRSSGNDKKAETMEDVVADIANRYGISTSADRLRT
jgi:hypothetical protein